MAVHSGIPRVVTKMTKMLPFVTSCNRNVTIFFPKKWIFLGARCAGNLKMGRKKSVIVPMLPKKKINFSIQKWKIQKFPTFGKGGRAHMGTFSKKMVTLSLWGFVTTIFYDTHYAAIFQFFYPFFFGYIWLHLVTFGYIFKK